MDAEGPFKKRIFLACYCSGAALSRSWYTFQKEDGLVRVLGLWGAGHFHLKVSCWSRYTIFIWNLYQFKSRDCFVWDFWATRPDREKNPSRGIGVDTFTSVSQLTETLCNRGVFSTSLCVVKALTFVWANSRGAVCFSCWWYPSSVPPQSLLVWLRRAPGSWAWGQSPSLKD